MSAGHTPGPWTFDGPEWNLIVWSSPENRVCFLAHSAGNDTERSFANARLIAAAPDLLAAGTDILETIEAQYRAGIRWDPDQVEALRAAIAKATGQ